jgi:hypothetical protein
LFFRDSSDAKSFTRKLHSKLDSLGYSVGVRLSERYCKDSSQVFLDPLDAIKFVCKEYWLAIFKKQIDKLQTNYKGIWVIHDFQFRWISRIGSSNGAGNKENEDNKISNGKEIVNEWIEQMRVYLSFACGLIRGALYNLGLQVSVKGEINQPPAVQFTIVDLEKNKTKSGQEKEKSSPVKSNNIANSNSAINAVSASNNSSVDSLLTPEKSNQPV